MLKSVISNLLSIFVFVDAVYELNKEVVTLPLTTLLKLVDISKPSFLNKVYVSPLKTAESINLSSDKESKSTSTIKLSFLVNSKLLVSVNVAPVTKVFVSGGISTLISIVLFKVSIFTLSPPLILLKNKLLSVFPEKIKPSPPGIFSALLSVLDNAGFKSTVRNKPSFLNKVNSASSVTVPPVTKVLSLPAITKSRNLCKLILLVTSDSFTVISKSCPFNSGLIGN